MTRGDRGAAAVLVLALAAALALLAAVTATLGAVAVARHRAASAADLAALAAADRALEGTAQACAAAARASAAVGGVLETCRLRSGVAEVVVAIRPAGRLGALGLARARARAGPPSSRGPDGRYGRGAGAKGGASAGQARHASHGGQLA